MAERRVFQRRVDQEVGRASFREEMTWKKEKLKPEFKELSEKTNMLEREVKFVQQQLQDRDDFYKGKEKALEREIAALKKELSDKYDQERNLSDENAKLKSSLNKMKNEIYLKELDDELKSYKRDKRTTWVNEKAKLLDENDKLKDENRELVAQVGRLRREKSHGKNKMKCTCEEAWAKEKLKLEAELSNYSRTIENQRKEIQELRRDREYVESVSKRQQESFNEERLKLERVNKCHTFERQSFQNKIDEQKKEIAELREKIAAEQTNYRKKVDCELKLQEEFWQKETFELKNKFFRRERQMEDMKNIISKLQEDVASKQQQESVYKEREEDRLNKCRTIERLRKKIDEQKNEMVELQEKLSAEQKNNSVMDCELKRREEFWQKEISGLKNDCSRRDRLIENFEYIKEGFVAERRKDIEKMNSTYQELLANERRKLDTEVSKYSHTVEKQREEIQKLLNDRDHIESVLKREEEFWQKETFELKNECSRRDRLIEDLKRVNSRLKEEFVAEQRKDREKIKELRANDKLKFETELSKYSHKVEKQPNEIQELRERCAKVDSVLEKQQSSFNLEKRQLEQHFANNEATLQDQIDEFKAKFAAEHENMDCELKRREEFWKNEMVTLKKEIERQNEEIEQSRTEKAEQKLVNENLENDKDVQEKKVRELKESFEVDRQNWHAILVRQQEIFNEERSKLENDCSHKDQTIKKLQEEVDELQRKMADLQEQQEDWEEDLIIMKQDLSNKNQIIENLDAKLAEQENKTVQLQDEIEQTKRQEESWKKTIYQDLYEMDSKGESIRETCDSESETERQSWTTSGSELSKEKQKKSWSKRLKGFFRR